MNIVYRLFGTLVLLLLGLNVYFGTSVYDGESYLFTTFIYLDEIIVFLLAFALLVGITKNNNIAIDLFLALCMLPLLYFFYEGASMAFRFAVKGSYSLSVLMLSQCMLGSLAFVYVFNIYRKYYPSSK